MSFCPKIVLSGGSRGRLSFRALALGKRRLRFTQIACQMEQRQQLWADAAAEPRTHLGGRRESNTVSVSFYKGKKIIKATSLLFGFLGCPYDLLPLKFCSPEAADSFIWMGATGPGDYSITISDASGAITLRTGNCPSPQPFFCA